MPPPALHVLPRGAHGAEPGVVLANHNAPDQVVIAGPDAAVTGACEKLVAAGLAARTIPVACAFHSPVVAGARHAFVGRLADADVRAPSLPVYACSTARPYEQSADEVRRGLADQIALPVRFVEQIEAMYAGGARVFVEAGPGGVLTELVGRILRGREHVAIACDRGGAAGVT
jgi:acyl transferase domain-containing protein